MLGKINKIIINKIPTKWRKRVITTLFLVSAYISLSAQVPTWQWAEQAFGSGSNQIIQEGMSIALDGSNNIYVAGVFSDTAQFGTTSLVCHDTFNHLNNYLAKYNQAGALLWAKGFSGYYPYIATDQAGNIYVTGRFGFATNETIDTFHLTSAGTADIFLAKFNSSGNTLWVKTFGGSSFDSPEAIATDPNGNIFITGFFMSPSLSFGSITVTNTTFGDKVFVVKLDSSGNGLWAKSAGGISNDISDAIATDNLGNVYFMGNFNSPSINFGTTNLIKIGHTDDFIVKLDQNGGEIWARSIGTATYQNQDGYISVNNAGEIFLADRVITNSGNSSFPTLYKYDTSGTLLWTRQGQCSCSFFGPWGLAADNNGNVFMVSGGNSGVINFGTISLNMNNPDEDNSYLIEYDSNGTAIWGQVNNGGGDDDAPMIIDNNCHLFLSGDFYTSQFIIGSDTLVNSNAVELAYLAKLNLPCSFTGVAEPLKSKAEITISPNPATTQLTIQSRTYGNNSTIETIHIYNVLGEMVQSSDIGHRTSDIGRYFRCKRAEQRNLFY